MSLKNKLHYSFILVTGLTIFITTAFSVMYFLGKIKNEATYNMKKNLKVTEMIYANKTNEIVSFTSNLSNDKAIQVLTDLDIRNKLSEYIKEGIVKKIKPDFQRAESLKQTAERKRNSLNVNIQKVGIMDENANDYIELFANSSEIRNIMPGNNFTRLAITKVGG